jgi:hypothetical protein
MSPEVIAFLSETYYHLKFRVLTAVSMKMAVFWVLAPCILVEVYRRVRGLCCLHHHCIECPDDGGSKQLRNVSRLLADYTAQQPLRQPYLHSSL